MAKKKPKKKAAKISSPAAFAWLVNQHKATGPKTCPLTNFTFFLGAGFSKSWSTVYPTGPKLFNVGQHKRDSLVYVERAANFASVPALQDLDMDAVKLLVYSLDMNRRYPAIRSRYADEQNIQAAKNEFSAFFCNQFRQIVGADWYWFDPRAQKFRLPVSLGPHQNKIQELFSRMFNLIDGSQGILEGARFNFITTNYDWLTEAIIDSVCDPEESALLYLYRSITPREIVGCANQVVVHQHDLVFNLLKINGGFEIFQDGDSYVLDYTQKKDTDYLSRAPILMLPSREQDHQSAYFNAVFPKAVRLLNESKVLVLVGYSLPEEDALLRFIIRQFCEDEADGVGKYLFYVDLADEATQLRLLRSVFPFAGRRLKTIPYSGNFADWAGAVAAAIT